MVIGLLEGKLDAKPTTCYLMTYRQGKCTANCSFCVQARSSRGRSELLSRVTWPVFSTKEVLERISGAFELGRIKRVCIQTLNYPEAFQHLLAILKKLRTQTMVPVSVSCQPLNRKTIGVLAECGVDRIAIPLDTPKEELFQEVKGEDVGGPYRWENQLRLLGEAVSLFGEGKVSTHLIVGLGETEEEMMEAIQKCVEMHVLPALFAFTPIPGTSLEHMPQPGIEVYRRIQLGRYLIVSGIAQSGLMSFDSEGKITEFGVEKEKIEQLVRTGAPFVTCGCPDCNRPFYNEKPSGPIYNYPEGLTKEETTRIARKLGL